jgi:hypothetical protein
MAIPLFIICYTNYKHTIAYSHAILYLYIIIYYII